MTDAAPADDGAAVPRTLAGDPAASHHIEASLRRWGGLVVGIVRRYGLGGHDAEEIRQDVRIRLWRALGRQDGTFAPFSASYVREAALSATIDLLRRRRRERRLLPLDGVSADDLSRPSGADDDLGERLERALSALPPDRAIAVRLHLAGHDRAEIARLTGWGAARTRHLLYRGLAVLRARLERGLE